MITPSLTWLVSACVASLQPAPPEAAPPPEPAPVAPVPASPQATPKQMTEFAARSIARLALIDLRAADDPRESDYAIASQLLGLAQELTPDDQDIIRWRMEAAWNAGDLTTTLALSQRIIELDPKDTVAQLRLISAKVAQQQDAEGRLALFDRFLGPTGATLDASVRSRLALDAALLHRERGEDQKFSDRLAQAVTLDSTNKEAAALLATFFTDQRPDDRLGRLELLSILLLADPVDPNVHLSIARELAAEGAFKDAQHFHTNAIAILEQAQSLGTSTQLESLILTWETKGPEQVLTQLNTAIIEQRERAAKQIKEAERRNLPIEGLRKPEEIFLSPEFAKTAILASDIINDRVGIERGVADLAGAIAETAKILADPSKRPQGMPEAEATRRLVAANADLAVMRLWTGVDVPATVAQLDPSTDLGRATLELIPALAHWQALRQGDAAGAAEQFAGAPPEDLLSLAGLLLAREALGQKDLANATCQRLSDLASLSPVGAWARAKAKALGTPKFREPDPRLLQLARDVPGWVTRAAREPGSAASFRVELVSTILDATERARAKIRIQNLAEVPLGLGADRPINSRILIGPRVENLPLGGVNIVRPEIVDIDRRLRLMPQERLEVEVWLDPGLTGWLIESMASQHIRMRWRAVQGFFVDQSGQYRPGPMSGATDTTMLGRTRIPEATFNPVELAALARGSELSLHRLAVALRCAALFQLNPTLLQPPAAPGMPPTRYDYTPVAEALAARFPDLSIPARMLLVASLPPATMSEELKVFDASLANERDPRVRRLILASRVASADDPILKAALTDADPDIQAFAQAVADRLARPGNFIAKMTLESLLSGTSAPAPEGAKAPPPASIPAASAPPHAPTPPEGK